MSDLSQLYLRHKGIKSLIQIFRCLFEIVQRLDQLANQVLFFFFFITFSLEYINIFFKFFMKKCSFRILLFQVQVKCSTRSQGYLNCYKSNIRRKIFHWSQCLIFELTIHLQSCTILLHLVIVISLNLMDWFVVDSYPALW